MAWLADRGFASAANRAYLTRGGGHYIHAEKLCGTNAETALARHRSVAGNLSRKSRSSRAVTGRRDTRGAVRELPQPRAAERDAAV